VPVGFGSSGKDGEVIGALGVGSDSVRPGLSLIAVMHAVVTRESRRREIKLPRGGSKRVDPLELGETCGKRMEVRFVDTAGREDGDGNQTRPGLSPGSRSPGDELGVGRETLRETVESEGSILYQHADPKVNGHDTHKLVEGFDWGAAERTSFMRLFPANPGYTVFFRFSRCNDSLDDS
jgi:hypothetical protein